MSKTYTDDEIILMLKFHDTLRTLGLIDMRMSALRVPYGAGTRWRPTVEHI